MIFIGLMDDYWGGAILKMDVRVWLERIDLGEELYA